MSKREAILRAATELFARQGFNGTAVSQIARQAGVAQGTVFHHFKSKENLLVGICDDLVREYIEGLNRAADGPGSGWTALERVLDYSQSFRKEKYNAIVVASRETRVLDRDDSELYGYFRGLMGQVIAVKTACIQRGVEDGSIRPVSPPVTSLILHILLSGVIHVQTQGLLYLPDLDVEIREFCRRSLCTCNESLTVGPDRMPGMGLPVKTA